MNTPGSGLVWPWLLLVVACGSATPTPPIEKTVLLKASYPADGEKGVPVNTSQISISFNLALAQENISHENVHLMPGDGKDMHPSETLDLNDTEELFDRKDQIGGHVHYDSVNNTLHFTPITPLDHGTTYHIHIQNLKTADGSLLADGADTIQFSFTTEHLMKDVELYYTKDPVTGEVITTKRQFFYNGDKSKSQEVVYKANNQINNMTVYKQLLEGGAFANSVVYKGNQETLLHYSMDVKDENGDVVGEGRIVDPGEDGIWGNSDDLLSRYTVYEAHHNLHTVINVYYVKGELKDVGVTAAKWSDRNNSFDIGISYLIEKNGPLFTHRTVFFSTFGANEKIDFDENGALAPIDDVVTGWRKRDFYPENGLRSHLWTMEGNLDSETGGIDTALNQRLYTEANEIKHLSYYEYTNSNLNLNNRLLHKTTTYGSAGDDGQWYTYDDNEVIGYEIYEYDALDQRQKKSVFRQDKNGEPQLRQEHIYKVF